jgi:hypothetical protein
LTQGYWDGVCHSSRTCFGFSFFFSRLGTLQTWLAQKKPKTKVDQEKIAHLLPISGRVRFFVAKQ